MNVRYSSQNQYVRFRSTVRQSCGLEMHPTCVRRLGRPALGVGQGEQRTNMGQALGRVRTHWADRLSLPPYLSHARRAAIIGALVVSAACASDESERAGSASRADPALTATGETTCPEDLVTGPQNTPFDFPPALQNRNETRSRVSRLANEIADTTLATSVWVLIGQEGRVEQAAIAISAGQGEIDRRVLQFAEEFSFHPADRSGVPVCVWLQVPLVLDPN